MVVRNVADAGVRGKFDKIIRLERDNIREDIPAL